MNLMVHLEMNEDVWIGATTTDERRLSLDSRRIFRRDFFLHIINAGQVV